jgi:hypothetical protein
MGTGSNLMREKAIWNHFGLTITNRFKDEVAMKKCDGFINLIEYPRLAAPADKVHKALHNGHPVASLYISP